MAATGALGALGVGWGVLARSQMILLDGVDSIVGIVLSALLLWASALSEREGDHRFPYGMAAATPLAIAIQAFVLLATLLYAAVEAVSAIRRRRGRRGVVR
jgi:predicted Co/Zn/Cd cation transporter (cation efflux family)